MKIISSLFKFVTTFVLTSSVVLISIIGLNPAVYAENRAKSKPSKKIQEKTVNAPAKKKKWASAAPVKVARVKIPTPLNNHQYTTAYRGWDYLVSKLRKSGVSERDILSIYSNPSFPEFSFIPFSPSPKESSAIYSRFLTQRNYNLGAAFINQYKAEFSRVEKTLLVPPEVVTAILLVESHLGENTGSEVVAYRLSRIASVKDPKNIEQNLRRLQGQGVETTYEILEARATYLEDVFLPEIPALIELGKRHGVNPLSVRGSSAGAFGWPQFLPSAFIRFGIDGDRNGLVSLYNPVDALWSTANYLANYGFKEDLSTEQKRTVIWKYNKSDAYVDTILAVADGIKSSY